MHLKPFDGQASAAHEQAAAAQAAARAASEQAREASQQARDQAQMIRDQAQMIRDAARAGRDRGQSIIIRPPSGSSGPSPRQEKMLFAGFVILVLAAVVILHPLVRAFARRLEGNHRKVDAFDAGSAERLQRIEQAVDAMAIEIERISEGQRFTTKLLSSRPEAPLSLEH